jgi:hypothetical protein
LGRNFGHILDSDRTEAVTWAITSDRSYSDRTEAVTSRVTSAVTSLYRFSAGARVRRRCPLSARDSGCATSDRVARGHIRRYFISGRSPKNITLINSTRMGAYHITSYICNLGYVNTNKSTAMCAERHTRERHIYTVRSAHQDNTWATHVRAKQSPARADTIVRCPARSHPAVQGYRWGALLARLGSRSRPHPHRHAHKATRAQGKGDRGARQTAWQPTIEDADAKRMPNKKKPNRK